MSTPSGTKTFKTAVLGRIIGDTVLPHSPNHSQPGPPEDADRVRVIQAAFSSSPVNVFGPGMMVAGGVRKGGHGVPEAFVAGPAEGRRLALARFDGYRAHASIGCQCLGVWVALSAVADLGDKAGGSECRVGVAKQREEDLAMGVRTYGAGDLGTEEPYLLDEGPEGGDECQDDRPAGLHLEFAGCAGGRGAQTREELKSGLAAAVAVSGEEAREALLTESARVLGTRVALQEGQRDRRVDVSEDHGRPRPEDLQLGAQAVGQRDPRLHEILAFSRVSDLKALVSSESGVSTRKRWWS